MSLGGALAAWEKRRRSESLSTSYGDALPAGALPADAADYGAVSPRALARDPVPLSADLRPPARMPLRIAVAASAILLLAGGLAVKRSLGPFEARGPIDVEFSSSGLTCDKAHGGYVQALPRFDPEWDTEQHFYNACYFSYRCCTSTQNHFCFGGANAHPGCASCVENHAPKMVRPKCSEWLEKCCTEGGNYDKESDCGGDDQAWGRSNLLSDDGVPQSPVPEWSLAFSTMTSCWGQVGGDDKRTREYSAKCRRVIEHCESKHKVCPRAPQTLGHDLCRACITAGGHHDEPFYSH
jgi:hypothetical protein